MEKLYLKKKKKKRYCTQYGDIRYIRSKTTDSVVASNLNSVKV